MCAHLSSEENWTASDHTVAANFKKYTFKSLNPRNVSAAFRDRLLYSSSYLQEILSARLRNAKPRCRGISSSRLDVYAPLHPDWCVQQGIELRHSRYHSIACGCSSDEKIDARGRSASCNNIYRHLNRERHPELFTFSTEVSTASAEQASLATSPDKLVASVQEDIMKKIKKIR